MPSGKRHGRQAVSVSASELAQMGVCERLVVFEHRYGKRRTTEQLQAIKRGLWAHQRFYLARHGAPVLWGRCVVRYLGVRARKLLRVAYRLIQRVTRWLHIAESRDGP